MQPISPEQEFTALRRDKAVYIDKTEAVSTLISYKRAFFSRPRRFGKSLTLSTIATLFKKGVDPYFKGTWIYDHWSDGTYPVLRLNCLKFLTGDFAEFCHRFCKEIARFADSIGISLVPDQETPATFISDLLDALPEDEQIVILIDEYDCGLTHNINNKAAYDDYVNCLHAFYAVLKGNDHIRFLGITGVTRLKNVTIFSIGSDITDVTYDSALSTLMGYTRKEIVKYFGEYVRDAVQKINHVQLSLGDIIEDNAFVKSFMDRLAAEYDGYCFDEDYQQKVFSTWSINNFFKKNSTKDIVSFGDYWFDNGGMPSILKNYLETHDLNVEEYTGQDHISPLYGEFTDPVSLLDINPSVLMCQTGYLTLRSELKSGFPLLLGIPNNEVRKALANNLYFKFAKKDVVLSYEQRDLLEHGSCEELFVLFNALFGSASYENYPVRDEATLRYPLQCFFMGAGISVTPEKQNARGRADLELEFPDRRIVIELKYVDDPKDADKALNAAVAQIKDRDYGDTLPLKKELMRLAMVFDGSRESRKFVRIEEC